MKTMTLWLVLASLSALSGCFSITSYVDPSYANGTVDDLQPVDNEYAADVSVQYFFQGKEYEDMATKIRDYVERSMLLTGVIVAREQDADYSLKIVVNNNGENEGSIAAGLTMGMKAATAVENLDIGISLVDKSGKEVTKQYEHKIHSTVGKRSSRPPVENAVPTSWDDALDTVVWQIVVNFLIDMQQDGMLTLISPAISNTHSLAST